MDAIAGKSYYIGYSSIDRFDTIIFFHNYLCTWSLGIFCSLILPILFLFFPSALHTKRSSHFFLICFVCLSNMCCLYIHPYMLTDEGEPALSFHTCRFIVYISTFAKPMGLYLTLLFSIERFVTKILRLRTSRLLFQRVYLVLIILGISSILVIRLIEVSTYIQRTNPSNANGTIISRKNSTNNENLLDRRLLFEHCYRSMTIETYAKILSFYVIQYWYEYITLAMIGLIFGLMIVYRICLPCLQNRSSIHWSVNMKFYLSLSSCVILFEFILHSLHLIVDAEENNNTDTQVNYLQLMLFVYNFRCIILPLVICLTSCDALKEGLYDLLIRRSYVEYIDENDRANTNSGTFDKFDNNEDYGEM